ncbi:Receptor protein kinase, putative isoform 2 [Capsicum annuum]|uniref:U-box domain-containing protein 32 isoform X1 n=2 Tax=Capsicum annuum TaxID=4072 RepID=UPI0007BEE571|nr:U-box domain-containing protein 32 isoform X1 [Capsicum annuum]KAF3623127.1 Receptor protein kinase, putative isoform 2 [Capsicum annuum]
MSGEEVMVKAEGICDLENTVFVAVGKNVKEGKSVLSWALKSFAGRRICVLHVHQPNHLFSSKDGKLSGAKLKQHMVKACQELDRLRLHKLLNQYLLFISQAGIQGGKVWLEIDNVEKGIIHIIEERKIQWLVMGAAAETHYSKQLSELKSSKAKFVCQHAHMHCHIWFTCSGYLIHTRSMDNALLSRMESLSSPEDKGGIKIRNHVNDGYEDLNILEDPSKPGSKVVKVEIKGDYSRLHSRNKHDVHLHHATSQPLLEEGSFHRKASSVERSRLEHAMMDAENSKQRAFEESVKRWRAEEDAMEAIRMAEVSYKLSKEKEDQRREQEENLAKQKEEIEGLKIQHDLYLKELQKIQEKKLVLESQITESSYAGKELEEKILQAVELLISFRKQRDEMQVERDNAIKEVNRFRKLAQDDADEYCIQNFFSISFSDIIEATQNFDPSSKIGEGKLGSVYKGIIHHIKVAIKMLPDFGSLSDSDFQNKAERLSRVRHPNLVTLMGICSESRSLAYEFLENGNLEDHLACREKSRPLHWHHRIRIAVEICSALIFVHANDPCIVHGNLRPTNVLLDAKFVSKISDFGVHLLISQNENSNYDDLEASIYVDPECIDKGPVTVESDVYSFGVILLRLLTARPASGIVRDVKCALESGNLGSVLDSSAGDWPIDQAELLAYLALRCCEKDPLNRPNMLSEVWPIIEPMRDICTPHSDLNTSSHSSKSQKRIPPHFVCPIFQDVMEDPHIAADGYTYEGDAIKGWLYSGHNTSPMTNLKLDTCDLIPNYALYRAIQEWQQQS